VLWENAKQAIWGKCRIVRNFHRDNVYAESQTEFAKRQKVRGERYILDNGNKGKARSYERAWAVYGNMESALGLESRMSG
jgi:hypothetical protein